MIDHGINVGDATLELLAMFMFAELKRQATTSLATSTARASRVRCCRPRRSVTSAVRRPGRNHHISAGDHHGGMDGAGAGTKAEATDFSRPSRRSQSQQPRDKGTE